MTITNNNDIKSILNISGSFKLTYRGNTIPLHGFLSEDNSTITLRCDTENENIMDYIRSNEQCLISGNICGKDITLTECYLTSGHIAGSDSTKINLSCTPNLIILGYQTENNITVDSITLYLDSLVPFFSTSIFNESFDFPDETLYLPHYSSTRLQAKYNNNTITISRTCKVKRSANSFTFIESPYIKIDFPSSTDIYEAIYCITSARNLFSFFADYNLPFDSLTLSIPENHTHEINLFLNKLNLRENIDTPMMSHFLIRENAVQASFSEVWKKWTLFSETSKHIVTLFLEIITDRSTGINRFLNLCQCLEVYSKYQRNSMANEIRKTYPKGGNKAPTLKHRLEDLFLYVNRHIGLSNSKCIEIATTISNARNYYTHYTKNKIEPSFECIVYSNIFLRFVLLLLIYMMLGIEDKYIEECKTREYHKIEEYIRYIRFIKI